ncbi:MAG: AAA family ATPase [Bulleidia sp.]
MNLAGISESLSFLMDRMYDWYHKKVIVLIDEYDTPFIEASVNGFYDEIRNDLSSLLQVSLKDSTKIKYAVLTGIQRVAKENIFSGLNNLKICTVCDPEYSQYFGFTEQEVQEMLKYYGLCLNDDVKAMYDGYHFGDTEIYNPWSIVNYAQTHVLKAFWVSTSSNLLIRKALERCDSSFKVLYEELIKNGEITVPVTFDTAYFEQQDHTTLWGLFVNAGYLTVRQTIREATGTKYTLVIPDDEVRTEFVSFTESCLNVRNNLLFETTDHLLAGEKKLFFKCYEELLHAPSYFDLQNENSYHMFMLGLILILQDSYDIRSNRESGYGRPDLVIAAKHPEKDPSFVMEFKYTGNSKESLEKLAEEGIIQIKNKSYDHDLNGTVHMISLAHCGKKAAMCWHTKQKH